MTGAEYLYRRALALMTTVRLTESTVLHIPHTPFPTFAHVKVYMGHSHNYPTPATTNDYCLRVLMVWDDLFLYVKSPMTMDILFCLPLGLH